MMLVALVSCKKSADKNCLGNCLKTYADGAHPGEAPGCYFHCGGCEAAGEGDGEMRGKMEKMKGLGIAKIHFTSCVKEDCPRFEALQTLFESNGFETEFACLARQEK